MECVTNEYTVLPLILGSVSVTNYTDPSNEDTKISPIRALPLKSSKLKGFHCLGSGSAFVMTFDLIAREEEVGRGG